MADNPAVAAGPTHRNPGQALHPDLVSGAQGIAASLPIPQYSNPASGAQYNTNGGPQAPYNMPVQRAHYSTPDIAPTPQRTDYKP
ncbi:MAG: hypothetical protein H0W02_10120 [Ktedonobacteraceae bacterium]|nr:hypothetical protein [Ktedonobacteraceae bacterium]